MAPRFRDSEVFLMHALVLRLDRLARQEVLANKEITYAEFLVLMAVDQVDPPVQENLGAFLDQSASLISQRVSSLREKGLVVQEPRPGNRRQTLIRLTEPGRARLHEAEAQLVAASDALWDLLGDGRAVFRDQLRRLAQAALEGTGRRPEPDADSPQ